MCPLENLRLTLKTASSINAKKTIGKFCAPYFDDNANDKIIRGPVLDFIPDENGIGSLIFKRMQRYKAKIAQIDVVTGNSETYESVLKRSIRTAMKMRAMGVTQEDIITLCSFNSLNSCIPFFASLFLGAKFSALDPTLSLNDTIYLLNQVRPKLIFVCPEAVDLIEKANEQFDKKPIIIVMDATTTTSPFSEFESPKENEQSFKPVKPSSIKDTAIILFSSGTSGFPKGMCLSHLTWLTQLHIAEISGFIPEVHFSFPSLYWVTQVMATIRTAGNGKLRLVHPQFKVEVFWDIVKQYQPTYIFLAPIQALEILHNGRPKDLVINHPLIMQIGGGPISAEQIEQIRNCYPEANVGSGYGQTELGGLIITFRFNNERDLHLRQKKPGSCGRLMGGALCKVVNEETEEECGPYESGEIRLKTDMVINGYYNTCSSDIWDKDGWYKTGDIAYYDEDQCFYIVDRIKEMLKYKSWHVSPAMLEAVIEEHPFVKSSAVIGIPHNIDGDHPLAFVVLKSNATGITPEDILNYVNKRVHERQQLRAGVKIIDYMPVTTTGKKKRRDLRDMIIRGLP